MSKLDPQVGDRVTVTHDPTGNTLTGVIAHFTSGETSGLVGLREFDFCLFRERGWQVTEVHEKPKPAPGTFIKGVDVDGDPFVGVVGGEMDDQRILGGYWRGDESGGTVRWGWEDIREWEVIL